MRRLLAGCALAATLIVALLDLAVVPGRAAVDAAPVTADPCAVVDSCGLGELAARSGVRFGFLYGPSSDAARQELSLRHSTMALNHALSWNVIEPSRGTYVFAPADAHAAYAEAHDLDQHGMHFVWDQAGLDDLPAWVETVTDADELRSVLRQRARVLFDRYPGLAELDVINEPLGTLDGALVRNHFFEVLGPDYVLELFAIVGAEAPPGVRLTINENLVEYSPEKADALVALAASVRDAGLRIDGVGLQTHLLFGGDPDWALYRSTMERIGALGLSVQVSELDVPVGQVPDRFGLQADRYRRVVETCLAVAACDEVFVWGLDDSETWLDGFLGPGLDPLLFDAALAPKPAYAAVYEALLVGRPGVDPGATTTTGSTSPALPGAAVVAPTFTG